MVVCSCIGFPEVAGAAAGVGVAAGAGAKAGAGVAAGAGAGAAAPPGLGLVPGTAPPRSPGKSGTVTTNDAGVRHFLTLLWLNLVAPR